MYRFSYSAAILLASIISSHARHTILISSKGEHSYLPGSSESDVCTRPECVIEASKILMSMDETVDPCDDFHRFACGGWMKRVDLPEDKMEVDVFSEMQINLNLRFKDLLESEYKSSDPPFVKMLKDFYNTCLDLESIEKQGSEPLKKVLSRLGGWPVVEGDKWEESTFDWLDTLISFRKIGFEHNILMKLSVGRKNENETIKTIHMFWPSNILPGGSNPTLGQSDGKISSYFKTIIKAAKLLGADESSAEKEILEVMNFLIAFRNSTELTEEREESNETGVEEKARDFYTVKELQEEVPQILWLKYFSGMLNVKVYEEETVYVGRYIEFLKKLVDLLATTEKRVIANYMMMRAVLESSQFLSEEWKSIDQEVRELFRRSRKNTEPRWKTCLSTLMNGMELQLSSYYVRHYFNDGSKDEAMVLVRYIRQEFLKSLEENDWMDEKTRKKAEEKANALKSYIGFPKELLNDTFMKKICENITISADSYLPNALTLKRLITDKGLSDFRKSEEELLDTRFTFLMQVNAFYNLLDNSMGVPAGILHDAFYEKDRPNYMNFGAIGYVIGHELTHGFDNKGRHYDKDGNEINWWDKESDERFRKNVQCIIDQYDNYTTDIGLKVNGERTQNENIADNGGLKEAYLAYQAWTKDNGIEPRLPALNYTQNQLFWLSAAHVWCSKTRPELLKQKIVWDPHSPDRFRIIGPMSNLVEFSRDFKCPADAPMNRKYKCKVW